MTQTTMVVLKLTKFIFLDKHGQINKYNFIYDYNWLWLIYQWIFITIIPIFYHNYLIIACVNVKHAH